MQKFLEALMWWHGWRAAVWNARLTQETKIEHFAGGSWTSVSPLGRFAEVMANYHEHQHRCLTEYLRPYPYPIARQAGRSV